MHVRSQYKVVSSFVEISPPISRLRAIFAHGVVAITQWRRWNGHGLGRVGIMNGYGLVFLVVDNVVQTFTSSRVVRDLSLNFFHCTRQKFAHMAGFQIGDKIFL